METQTNPTPLVRSDRPIRETKPAQTDDKPPRLVRAPVRIPGQRAKAKSPVKYPAGYWLG